MRPMQAMASGLAWLGRHGTRAVAAAMFAGIALPPLGAILRPYFPETVVVLLVLSFLRVDPARLRAQWTAPGLILAAAAWTMLLLPLLFLLLLILPGTAIADAAGPALLLALVLHAAAPPTFSSPSLAALIGLSGAVSLSLLLASTALTPFTSPALTAAFLGDAVTLSPTALGARLVLILAGAAAASLAIRGLAGPERIERLAPQIDGLSVIALFLFAIALMGDVLVNVIARPFLVLGLTVLATSVALLFSAVTAAAFWRTGRETALTLGHAAGSRNMGLMLAAAAGQVPEVVWLYVALAQFPIYLLPLPFKPLVRRLLLSQHAQ